MPVLLSVLTSLAVFTAITASVIALVQRIKKMGKGGN